MLDEPLGALDRTLREQLLDELRDLLHHTGIPAIYVTHDQEEAYSLADRMILLHDGRVVQDGSPSQKSLRPRQLRGRRLSSAWATCWTVECASLDPLQFETVCRQIFVASPGPGFQAVLDAPATLLFQSEGTRLVEPDDPRRCSPGKVDDLVFRGDGFHLSLRFEFRRGISFRIDRPAQIGERVGVSLPPGRLLALRGRR